LTFGGERQIGGQQPQHPTHLLVLALVGKVKAVLRLPFELTNNSTHHSTSIGWKIGGLSDGRQLSRGAVHPNLPECVVLIQAGGFDCAEGLPLRRRALGYMARLAERPLRTESDPIARCRDLTRCANSDAGEQRRRYGKKQGIYMTDADAASCAHSHSANPREEKLVEAPEG
jgi:hypothetical protein